MRQVCYKSEIHYFFISSIEVVKQQNQITGDTFQAVLWPYLHTKMIDYNQLRIASTLYGYFIH